MREINLSKKPSKTQNAQHFFGVTGKKRSNFFSSEPVQAKLSIGQPGDKYEQEADAVADRVVSGQSATPVLSTAGGLNRKCAECDQEDKVQRAVQEEEEAVQAKESEEEEIQMQAEEEEEMQTKSSGPAAPGSSFTNRLHARKGSGSNLSGPVRAKMESSIGADFSGVRVHNDREANQMSSSIQAQAFTRGNDVYFNAGKYRPESTEGQRLLAHELTHVVQQGAAPSGKIDQRTLGDGHDLTNPRFAGETKLEQAFDNEVVIKNFTEGEHVRKIQQALIDDGIPLPAFGADGKFGSETKTGLITYQNRYSLSIDGEVGPETMGHMDTHFISPAPPTPGPPSPPPAPAATISTRTIAPSPGARTRKTIGVGEEVDLTLSTGTGPWATTAGTLSATTGPKIRLTAPDTGQSITVTAGAASVTFSVKAPNRVHMDRFSGTGIRHKKDRPDSGIQTRPFILPDTVNFYNIQYREVDVGATATGVYSCFVGIGHDPHPATLSMSNSVTARKGTRANAMDTVYSGDCGTATPFASGRIRFLIPNEYKVGAGSFHRFAIVNQTSRLGALSILTSTKAGASGVTTVGSPTSTF